MNGHCFGQVYDRFFYKYKAYSLEYIGKNLILIQTHVIENVTIMKKFVGYNLQPFLLDIFRMLYLNIVNLLTVITYVKALQSVSRKRQRTDLVDTYDV